MFTYDLSNIPVKLRDIVETAAEIRFLVRIFQGFCLVS